MEPAMNKYREAKGDMLQELKVFKEENERLRKIDDQKKEVDEGKGEVEGEVGEGEGKG